MSYSILRYNNPIYSSSITPFDPSDKILGLSSKCIYKVKIRNKIVYHIELYFYKDFGFIKFYPKKFENDPNRYKRVGIGLTLIEKRSLFMTCCEIVSKYSEKNPDLIYAFVAQVYDRDNDLDRLISIRYSIYKKLVTTYFSSDEYLHFSMDHFNFYAISKMSESDFIKKLQALIDKVEQDEDFCFQFMTQKQQQELIKL